MWSSSTQSLPYLFCYKFVYFSKPYLCNVSGLNYGTQPSLLGFLGTKNHKYRALLRTQMSEYQVFTQLDRSKRQSLSSSHYYERMGHQSFTFVSSLSFAMHRKIAIASKNQYFDSQKVSHVLYLDSFCLWGRQTIWFGKNAWLSIQESSP